LLDTGDFHVFFWGLGVAFFGEDTLESCSHEQQTISFRKWIHVH